MWGEAMSNKDNDRDKTHKFGAYVKFRGLYVPPWDDRAKVTEEMLSAGESELAGCIDHDVEDAETLIARAYLAMKKVDPDFQAKKD